MALRYPDPELRSDLVRLRRWRYDDVGCIRAASLDPEIPKGTTVPATFSEADGQAFIERQWARNADGRALSLAIAIADTDEAVGLVFLAGTRVQGECRLGYWLVPDARRRGFGGAAIGMVSRWVLLDTEMHRLVARVLPSNAASIAVLRACGFREEGVLRKWLPREGLFVDALQFSLIDDDLEA